MSSPSRISTEPKESRLRAWLDDAPLRRHVVRYEDLRAQPETVFGEIVEACGLPRDDARIGAAVRFSDFSELRRQEAENGFAERHPNARDNFFRSGRIGSWRDEIGDELADRIREAHGPMMDRMNYQ